MILAGVISRGTTIMAKYIQVTGIDVFIDEFIDKELAKVIKNSDTRNHYSNGKFQIYYIRERGIVYLAIAEKDIPQENAFNFLEEVKEKFQSHVGDRARNALAHQFDGDFGVVLKNGMLKATPDKLDIINKDMEEIKALMIENIKAALDRGEKLEDVIAKTDQLKNNAGTFRGQAGQLQGHMWCILLVLTDLVLLIKEFITGGRTKR